MKSVAFVSRLVKKKVCDVASKNRDKLADFLSTSKPSSDGKEKPCFKSVFETDHSPIHNACLLHLNSTFDTSADHLVASLPRACDVAMPKKG